MKINYNLDKAQRGVKPADQKETTIYLFIRSGQTKIQLNTGRRVLPKCWDTAKQEVKNMPGSPELNGFLGRLKEDVRDIVNSAKGKLTAEDVREAVTDLIKGKEIEDKRNGFTDAFEEYVKAKQINWSKSYLDKNNALRDHLQEYARIKKKPLKLERMDKAFIEGLVSHLLTYRKPAKDPKKEPKEPMTNNTVVKAVSMLKNFLDWAVESGHTEQVKFKKFKFPKGFSKEADTLALSEQELMHLYLLDLSGNPALARVRDIFCFSAFTLQRFSDVARLQPKDVKGNTWTLRPKKTNSKKNLVPLNEFAQIILERYDNQLPTISNQQTNLHLATLGKLAGFDDVVTVTRFRGTEEVTETGPKYNFIGTHTGRRTGATILLRKGVNFKIVMKIGGWASFKSFEKYIRLVDTDAEAAVMGLDWSRPAPIMQAV